MARPSRSISLVLGAVLLLVCARAASGWALSWLPQGSALDHDALPFYSHGDFLPRWDDWSRARTVGNFQMVDQYGAAFDQRMLGAGPTVISFFWSVCLTKCPVSIDFLRQVKGKPHVMLISDQPLMDSPAALHRYAARLGLPQSWTLATGAPGHIYRFARMGLFTDVSKLDADGVPRHSDVDYLIDRKGRLRGLYNAISGTDMLRLENDYAILSRER